MKSVLTREYVHAKYIRVSTLIFCFHHAVINRINQSCMAFVCGAIPGFGLKIGSAIVYYIYSLMNIDWFDFLEPCRNSVAIRLPIFIIHDERMMNNLAYISWTNGALWKFYFWSLLQGLGKKKWLSQGIWVKTVCIIHKEELVVAASNKLTAFSCIYTNI